MTFADRLREGVVVADGGIGSLLAGRFGGEAPNLLARAILEVNLSAPEAVHEIHLQYIAAGAELIETNSFGANAPRLAWLGLDAAVIGAAAKIARDARDASGKPVWIGGSVAPLDPAWLLEENPTAGRQEAVFAGVIEALLDRGADLIVLETFSNLSEAVLAARAVRRVAGSVPFLAQMTFDERGLLRSGEDAAEAGRRLLEEGALAVGVNCGVGPSASLSVLSLMAGGCPGPFTVMPNAGFAQRLGARVIYPDMSDATYAGFALEARRLGARVIGGCCGTTPRQIRAIAAAIAKPEGAAPASGSREAIERARLHAAASPPEPEVFGDAEGALGPVKTSGLAGKLSAGRFVWSLQIDPQRGSGDQANREVVRRLLQEGTADLVDINSSGQGTRQDSLQIAAGIERMGIETLAHITPRDASVAGILSQVVGAHDWGGIRNVLVITGDPPKGDFIAEAKGVYQVDVLGLLRALDRLRRGQVVKGNTTIPPFQLLIGVAVNQNAPDLDVELARLTEKLEAGADFVMTQPMFSPGEWEAFWKRAEPVCRVPVLAGAWPLLSLRQAIRINENVSGVLVPEVVLEQLSAAGPREREVGFALAKSFCDELVQSESAAGVYVVAPFKQPRIALDLFPRRE